MTSVDFDKLCTYTVIPTATTEKRHTDTHENTTGKLK